MTDLSFTTPQEPLLAARILVEDCNNVLLDVDDIDRKVIAARERERSGLTDPQSLSLGMQAENDKELMQRRGVILSFITSVLRLSSSPILSSSSSNDTYQSPIQSDGVFEVIRACQPSSGHSSHLSLFMQRVMMLSKGRKMLSRTLLTLASTPFAGSQPQANPHALHLIWAALRTSHLFFGAPSSNQANPSTSFLFYLTGSSSSIGASDATSALAESSSKVAYALIEAMQRIVSAPDHVTGCLEALCQGLGFSSVQKKGAPPLPPTASILPFLRTNKAAVTTPLSQSRGEWLGDVIVMLMARGQELRHEDHGSVTQRWMAASQRLAELILAHLSGVAFILASASQSGGLNASMAATLRSLAGREVIAAVSIHVLDETKARMQAALTALGI